MHAKELESDLSLSQENTKLKDLIQTLESQLEMLRNRKGLNNVGRKIVVNEERKKYPKLGENIMYKEKGKMEWKQE